MLPLHDSPFRSCQIVSIIFIGLWLDICIAEKDKPMPVHVETQAIEDIHVFKGNATARLVRFAAILWSQTGWQYPQAIARISKGWACCKETCCVSCHFYRLFVTYLHRLAGGSFSIHSCRRCGLVVFAVIGSKGWIRRILFNLFITVKCWISAHGKRETSSPFAANKNPVNFGNHFCAEQPTSPWLWGTQYDAPGAQPRGENLWRANFISIFKNLKSPGIVCLRQKCFILNVNLKFLK